MKKPHLAFTTFLSLAIPLAHAAEFHYQQQGEETLYTAQSEPPEIISRLTGVDFAHLQRIADLSQPNETTPLSNINTDTWACSTSFNDVPAICDYHHAWLSDGRQILWAGKKVIGADAASFRAYGRFAADKQSLYFDGERTDDNPADNPLDMATLEEIGSDLAEGDASNIVKDRHNLYYHGRRLGSADGFVLLGLKSWDQRGSLIDYSSCEPARNAGPWDILVRNINHVFINGEPINADPDSFEVVRWMPGSLLIYRDKHGEKRLSYGRNCTDIFDIQLGKVTWRTRPATPRGNDCRVETLPDVAPENFNVISRAIAQYKDRVYIVKDRDFLDQRLSIIKIADPELELDTGINVTDSNRAYVVSEDSVLTVRTAGKMVRIKLPDGEFSQLFAHDNRYVYAFLEGDMWRYKTARPEAAYINEDNDLVIDEGKYRSYGAESKFIPRRAAEKK